MCEIQVESYALVRALQRKRTNRKYKGVLYFRLAHMTMSKTVPQLPSVDWKAKETNSYLVYEAQGLRVKEKPIMQP